MRGVVYTMESGTRTCRVPAGAAFRFPGAGSGQDPAVGWR